ncbi:MAG TPA: type II toxin-antitoxin system RelE/ParE family toxin [Allosphingosinicella sp.]|jgi:hypothetical protein
MYTVPDFLPSGGTSEGGGEKYILSRIFPRGDLKKGLRSLPAGEHRIYYRFDGETVLVARVLHKAMDEGRHL